LPDSISLSRPDFHSLVDYGLAALDADVYLSGFGYPGENRCYIGLEPTDQLLVRAETTDNDIKQFISGDEGPVLGFLSYTYGLNHLNLAVDPANQFPLGHLKRYSSFLEYDSDAGQCRLLTKTPSGYALNRLLKDALNHRPDLQPTPTTFDSYQSSLNRNQYIDLVEATIEKIRAGYIYQMCLSIKYSSQTNLFDISDTFLNLWRNHPAPFYAFFHSDPYQIISTSPERFLKVDRGEVLSQPIKGTLPFQNYDNSLVNALVSSPKESSELSMIVDMIRNDISLNCAYGSVAVDSHKSTFVVDNLVQMYSNVRGRLKPGRTAIDLFLDAFPGGSVTGCPKKKAIEIIYEFEPHDRDIYCGSFFVIKDEMTLDSSIAIRTGYLNTSDSLFHNFAGSGIVIGSDPVREYEETTAKAQKFLALAGSKELL
jgi:para-aminobenzoate synthetase component 1